MFKIEEIENENINSSEIKNRIKSNTGYDFDEGKAMNLLKKKRVNKPKKRASKKKYKNIEGAYRNNVKNYQYDYEEDFYEPENK